MDFGTVYSPYRAAVQDLFPGLNERPPHAEILTQAFDVSLPAIDLPLGPRRRHQRSMSEEEEREAGALGSVSPRMTASQSPTGEGAVAGAAAGGDSDEVRSRAELVF